MADVKVSISRRIASVSPSPTVALNSKAKAMAREGTKVLNFAVGEPDFSTPQAIVEVAIDALRRGQTKYGPAGGGEPLRQAIASRWSESGLDIAPENIICGLGAKQILFHLFLAHLNDGDEVLVPAPYWVSYTEQIKAAGGRPVIVPMPTPTQGAMVDPGDLEKYATERTVGVVLTSPNNPAGYVLDEAQLKAIGRVVLEKGWWVISDEIYESMSFDKPHVSLLKIMPELQQQFFLVHGLSKGYAMTGWRVGYLGGPPASIKLMKSLQSHSTTCLPPFVEAAATFAISKGPALLENEIARLKARRDLAVQLLDGIPGVSYIPPEGAFYVFIDLRQALSESRFSGQNSAQVNTLEFAEHLLVHEHIAMVPGEAFGTPGFLRLSYAAGEEQIKEGLTRLKKAVAAL